jgi:hypothetical protein
MKCKNGSIFTNNEHNMAYKQKQANNHMILSIDAGKSMTKSNIPS